MTRSPWPKWLRFGPDHIVFALVLHAQRQAGVCIEAIRSHPAFRGQEAVARGSNISPVGHQSMGQALGGKIIRAKRQMHGKASTLTTDQRGVYTGLPKEFSIIRYHSLVIEDATCPAVLEVTSRSEDGEIMGVRHRELAGSKTPMEGVQFHPSPSSASTVTPCSKTSWN